MIITKMMDMTLPKETKSYPMPVEPGDKPIYPYGLCISLCDDEIEKLNLDVTDVEVGDMLHLFAMATVTSVSKRATESGECCRIELQITHLGLEDENEEGMEEE